MNSIVSVRWLAEQLSNPDVVIVDCRFQLNDPDWGQEQYRQGHIPGAYYLDLDRDLSGQIGQHGGRHPLPDPQALAPKLAAMGIKGGETWVVAYDDSRFAFAARAWWLLNYLGHDRVALLDGGWLAWQEGGYPISTETPTPKAGNFVPQVQSHLLVDIETLKAGKDSDKVVLVDARDSDRYRGEREPIDPVAGHIPAAVNHPWKETTDERGTLQPEHAQRWQNYKDAEEIVVYCGSGVTACVNLFSLQLAGDRRGKLYAGSWSDWCSYQEEVAVGDRD